MRQGDSRSPATELPELRDSSPVSRARYWFYEAPGDDCHLNRANSFGDAGGALDDVLRRARERAEVEIESIQLSTPTSAGPVSLTDRCGWSVRRATTSTCQQSGST